MARRRDKNEIEWYRGQIRELESENRRLKRQLREAQKSFEYVLEDDKTETKPAKCPECGKGNLQITDLKIKLLITCDLCNYRKTENK